MYLNNNITTLTQSEGDDHKEFERQRLEAKRRELIESCKHIRSIFETQFHPHDADNESSSYLDMNGANNNKTRQLIEHATSDACQNGKISCKFQRPNKLKIHLQTIMPRNMSR